MTKGILTALTLSVTLILSAPNVQAATISFNGSANVLTSGAAWVGGVAPGYLDIAQWDANATGNLSQPLGASTNWSGISITTPSDAVTIPSDGSTLTLGASGINMSGANQNLTLNCGLTPGSGGESWNVASSQTLTIGGTITRNPGDGTVDFPGSGTVTGSGISGITQINGIIPWATVAGANWATLSGGSIAAYGGYTTFPTTVGGSSSANYQVTSATQAGTGNTLANSIKLTAALTTSATRQVTVTSGGGLLFGTGGSISSGNSNNIFSSGELIMNVASGVSVTTLRAESVKAVTLVKTGPGSWTTINQNELANVSQTIRIAQGDLTVAGSTQFSNNVVFCQNFIVDAGASFGLTGSPGNFPLFGGSSLYPIAISGAGTIGGGGTQSPNFGAYCTIYPGTNGTYGTLTTGSAATTKFLTGCSFGFDLSSNPSGPNDSIVCPDTGISFTIAANAALHFLINPMGGLGTGTYTLINGSAGSPSVSGTGVTYPLTFPNGGDPGTGNRSIAYNSVNKAIQLTVSSVSAIPTISGLNGPSVTATATSGNLTYTGTTGSPTQYYITWSPAALAAGFANTTYATLPASPIPLTLPGTQAIGQNYTGFIIVSNTTSGATCYEQPFTVQVPSCTEGTQYNVTGGTGCSSNGLDIGLANSQTGYNYGLYNGATAVGTFQAGNTGSALDFGTQTAVGTYTVWATNTVGGCANPMSGTAVVQMAPSTSYTVGGGGCSGSAPSITLSSSDSGVLYYLFNGANIVAETNGTGSGLIFLNQTAAGTYTIDATNAGCGLAAMTGSATVTAAPAAPTNVLAAAGNAQIQISWSAGAGVTPTSYNLYRGPSGAETLYQTGVTSPYTDTAVTNGIQTSYEVTALNGSCESVLSDEVSATPNSAFSGYTLTVSSSGTSTQTAGSAFTATVTAVNSDGSTASGVSGSIGLIFGGLAASPGGQAPTVTGLTTFASGQATVTINAYDATNSAMVTATDGTHATSSPEGAPLTLTVSPSSDSAYRINAATSTPAVAVGDALAINIVDQYQNPSSFSGNKTITFGGLSAGPDGSLPTVSDKIGNAINFGTATTITFASGVNSAGGSLVAHKVESSKQLTATDGVLSATGPVGTAPTLSPVAGAAARLGIVTQPSAVDAAGAAFATQPTVNVLDLYGNPVTASTASIGISAAVGNLSGTFPTNAVAGVATFSGLSLTNAGTNTLTFNSSGLASTNSSVITVSAGSFASIGWVTQPAGAVYRTVFGIEPVLATVDQYGNPTTNGVPSSIPVTVALTSGPGALSGTTNYDLGSTGSNGVVHFTDLTINAVSNNFVLTATGQLPAGNTPPVTGMAVWLDSSVASSVLTSAGNVVQWNDLSGNNYNFNLTEGSGSITYGTTNMNGKPVVSFPGSSAPAAALLTTNNVYTFNGTSMTLFTVVRTTSTFPDYTGPFDSAGAGGADGSSTTWGMNSMYPYNDRFTVQGTTVTGTPTLPTGTPFIWEGADNGPASQEWVGYDDGTTSNLVSNTTGTQSAFAITQLAVGGTLGGVNSLSQQWNGDVAEVLLYNSYLTPSQQAQIYSYLQSKWLGGGGGGATITTSTATFSVAPAPLTITGGITANSKAYDGTTNATLTIGTVTFSGVFAQDNGNVGVNTSGAVGSFANAGPGNSIPVTVTGITTTGTAAGDYTVAPLALSANITQAASSEPVHVSVSGGVVNLNFNGASGAQYILQRSTNLSIGAGWVSISTNNATSNTVFNVTDTFPDIGFTPTTSFYRLLMP